jgi:hypothetical protein
MISNSPVTTTPLSSPLNPSSSGDNMRLSEWLEFEDFKNLNKCPCAVPKTLSDCEIKHLIPIYKFLSCLVDTKKISFNEKYDLFHYESTKTKLLKRGHIFFHTFIENPQKRHPDFVHSFKKNYLNVLSTLPPGQTAPFRKVILTPLINSAGSQKLNSIHQVASRELILNAQGKIPSVNDDISTCTHIEIFCMSLSDDRLLYIIGHLFINCIHSHEKISAICPLFGVKPDPEKSLKNLKKECRTITETWPKGHYEHKKLVELACRIIGIAESKIDDEEVDPEPSGLNEFTQMADIITISWLIPEANLPYFMKYIAAKLIQSPWRARWITQVTESNTKRVNLEIAQNILNILTGEWKAERR